MRNLIILLVPTLLLACRDEDPHTDFIQPCIEISPQGYQVAWIERSMMGPGNTLDTGRATLDEIYQWHSDAVDRAVLWFNAHHGVPIAEGYAHAKGICWVLVDNCTFRTLEIEGNLPSTWANGQWILYYGVETIYVPLYRRIEGNCTTEMPPDAPPWTINHAPWDHNLCRWGVLEPGKEFPALRHELGHAIWNDPNFEH